MGMGGAYTALADDYSGLYYNPAGLGQIDQSQIFWTFSHLLYSNRATFLGSENLEKSAYTKLNDLGAVIPLPTVSGSLVLGFGIHRVQDYDKSLFVTRVINTPGDSVTWQYDEMEEGGLRQASFGGSIEMAPDLFLGMSVNFWYGVDEYTWRFTELDEPYDLYTFSEFHETTFIKTRFVGVNLSAGFLYKVMETFRLGLVVETPVNLNASEDWEYSQKTRWDDGVTTQDTTDSGLWEYSVRSPWKIRLGGALSLGPLLLSGDVQLTDYTQIRYSSDPAETGSDFSDTNLDIRRNFQNTMDYRIGAEFHIPATPVRLRGGWGIVHSPLKNALSSWNRTYISLGGGAMISDRLILDGAYVYTGWDGVGDEVIEKEKIKAAKILISLTYLM